MDWPQGDVEVCDWLEELVKQTPKEHVFEYRASDSSIYFRREDDAIAFKLRFGL
jgi:hypothetical protein